MKRLIGMVALLALVGSLQAQDAAVPATNAAPDEGAILRRARIPSDDNVHGETRLIHRNHGACVQTLLHTTALRRGVHEMLKKEQAGWPEGAPGAGDSQAFCAALVAAKAHVLTAGGTNAPDGGLLSMLMEVSLTPTTAGYAFYDVTVSRADGEFVVSDKRLIAEAPASRFYTSRAMLLMSGAAFHLDHDALTNLLTQAGWEPSGPEDRAASTKPPEATP